MTEYVPSTPKFLLKAIGSADDPMAADWFDSAPQERSIVHFSRRKPRSVRVDDYLVYYAAGWGKLLGVVQVHTKPAPDVAKEPGDRWPYFCVVKERLMVKDIDRAPSVDVLSTPKRDFRKTVMQMDYTILSEEERLLSLRAIDSVIDESKSDIRDPDRALGAELARMNDTAREEFRKRMTWEDGDVEVLTREEAAARGLTP